MFVKLLSIACCIPENSIIRQKKTTEQDEPGGGRKDTAASQLVTYAVTHQIDFILFFVVSVTDFYIERQFSGSQNSIFRLAQLL